MSTNVHKYMKYTIGVLGLAVVATLLAVAPTTTRAQGVASPTPWPWLKATSQPADALKQQAEEQRKLADQLRDQAAELENNADHQVHQAEQVYNDVRNALAVQNAVAVGEALGRGEAIVAQLRETLNGLKGINQQQAKLIERLQGERDQYKDKVTALQYANEESQRALERNQSANSNSIVASNVWVFAVIVLSLISATLIYRVLDRRHGAVPVAHDADPPQDALEGEFTSSDTEL